MYKLTFGNYNDEETLYRIYIKNGIAYVDTLKVIDPLSKQTWYQSLVVGEAKDVSIEFNGFWVKDEVNQRYKLVTEEKPWIFWIDNSNNLYGQIWDDVNSRVQFSSSVVKLSTLRGWKNVFFWNHDQGLIITYIKSDEKAYYRNYCKQPPDQPALWEVERELTAFTPPVQDIALFRTNDYRVGFMAVSNGTTYWALTERDWAGMGIPIERITASPVSVNVEFLAIEYFNMYEPAEQITASPSLEFDLGYTLTDNHFVEIYNQPVTINGVDDWGKVLIIRTEHGLYNLDPSDFEITDSYNRIYLPNTIEKIGDRTYKLSYLDLNNFNNVDKVGIMRFKGLITTNAINVLYQSFEMVFYPQNLVPTYIPLPEVVSIWNE